MVSASNGNLIAVFGTDEPTAAEHEIAAGKLAVRISDGQIKSVTWDGAEIARGITYFLRDADWATPLPTTSVSIAGNRRGARIEGEIDTGPIRFTHATTLEADPQGVLRIVTEGRALSAFKSNRVGLTILHPVPDCAGVDVTVTHYDGAKEETRFPQLISPSQPVFDIRAMAYRLTDSENVEIAFSSIRPDGTQQAFEMEDQRNWGDASYKTYVGSLRDPWPFDVLEGDVFAQEITITVKPCGAEAGYAAPSETVQSVDHFRVPEIGIAVPLDGATEALANIKRFGTFKPGYVSAYLRSDALKPEELEALGQISETLGCRLSVELEVHGEPAETLASVSKQFGAAALDVHSILACPEPYLHSYQPDAEWPDVMPLDEFYALVRGHFPHARVGGGMLTYFTELNRKWPPAAPIDYVGHAYSPIIHAADDETVLQNIATLPFIAATIAGHLPGMPYEIISARLSMRQNPYGAAPQPNPDGKRIAMAIADPREKGQFGALWMLEIAETVASTHAGALCLGALSGEASIYDADTPDGRLPAYYAVEALAGLTGADEARFDAVKSELEAERFAAAREAFDSIRRR